MATDSAGGELVGEGSGATPGRGRPRSGSVDAALAKAATEEFLEFGYRRMTMESVAARAGVSKVSLYRRWGSKEAVVADVLRGMSEAQPPEDCGSLEADVLALLETAIGSPDAKSAATVLMRTMGEISGSPELLALYRTYLLAPRLAQLRAVVTRAHARGELRRDLAPDVAGAMIAGPLFLYYLNVLAEAEVVLPEDLAAQIARAILDGIAKKTS